MASSPKGRAVIEILLDSNQLNKQLKAVEDRFKRVGANIVRAGAGFTAFGAALIAPLVAATKSFVDFGDTVGKIATRTGASAEFISALGFAAEQSGADIQTLEKAIVGQQRTLNDMNQGLKTAIDSYAALGLTAKDFEGLNTEQSFTKIAQALSEVKDPSLRAATALEIFGKAGQKLIPLLNGGEAAIQSFIAEANKTGIVISGEDAAKAEVLADSLNRASKALRGLKLKVGASLANQFTLIIDKLTEYIVKGQEFIDKNRGLVSSVLKLGAGIAGIGVILTGLGLSAIVAGSAIGSLTSIVSALGVALTLTGSIGAASFAALISPLGIITLALTNILLYTTNLGNAISDTADGARSDLSGAFKDAKNNFDLLQKAVATGDLKLAFSVLATSIKTFFLKAFNSIINAYDDWVALTNSGLNNVAVSFQQAFLFIKQLWLRLRLVFSETSDALASAFLKVLPKIQNLFVSIITKIKLLWLDIKGLFAAGIKVSKGNLSGAKEILMDVLKEREKIKATAEAQIQANLKLSFGDVESELSKKLRSDINGIEKEINRLEKGALDFSIATADVADDQKAERAARLKELEQTLLFLKKVTDQRTARQADGQQGQQDGQNKDVANAIKSIAPQFGSLVETGSSAALKLFGSNQNPMVKEQQKTNKTLQQIAENTNGLEVR